MILKNIKMTQTSNKQQKQIFQQVIKCDINNNLLQPNKSIINLIMLIYNQQSSVFPGEKKCQQKYLN